MLYVSINLNVICGTNLILEEKFLAWNFQAFAWTLILTRKPIPGQNHSGKS